MLDDLSLAATVQAARIAQDLSVNALAERSEVSRAMIAKIERGEAQPTAALLGRLSGALGMTLSELIARAENTGDLLRRQADQPVWVDPATGYSRRAVSPVSDTPLELVEVELPARASVSYPADAYVFKSQQLWILAGHLRFHEGPTVHDLHVGDCLQLSRPTPTTFHNPGAEPCRYLVALVKLR
ncbi:helix-turn-helix transcriptional regulator [Kribbella sandramycini]|uniref:Helix-turn-helix transcriptional regulator n=1 Tax=Kribbella sandramycini TaxID=60450 RepID=A0A7Y4P1T8_9ACTN|nr:helix-turn-helix domain-containing protein [Kribbella sandramycini]MBB6564737.1 transcriptional regulator with XRE-family HTH domain [Kribbella sandramycini]NOL42439.1 helix-turn-helix transcriptional regulator [Kribbella sandramycini]